MAARVRRRVPWFDTVGPVLVLAEMAAMLLAGLVTGAAAGPLLVATLVAVLVAWAADLHRPRLVLSIVDDLPGLLVAAASAAAVLVGSGASGISAGLLTFACLVLAHTTVHAVTHVLRRLGRLGRRVLVVGTGAPARQLASTLLLRPELGLRPVGFVGTGAASSLDQARGLPLALVGSVSTLPRAMAEARVDAVVVALSGPPGDDETAAIAGLLAAAAEVYAVPTWLPPGPAPSRHTIEVVGDLQLVRLRRRATWPPLLKLRRLVEALVAALTVLAVLPVFAALALLVLVETGGVLVRRPWLVEPGRPGPPLRFRTRRSRSVARPGTTFSVAIPGRMGPVGRLLRRTGLDALPEVMRVLLRRVRYAGGVPDAAPGGSAPAPSPDQPQVDTGQLAG
ncbi:MAG TPA: sugar transferase [Nocardioides sp.]|uniref:sugar transferase n=1 Tax=Nocardioides sp. TaxID=35761 RepID=UPI002E330EA4|nr:sugar transferase [Nocardioides sp.]HEX5089185.1 sugar transferase [Nocardioides sp.]